MRRVTVIGMTIPEIEELTPSSFLVDPMTQEEFRYVAEAFGTFWQYPGEPGTHPYHALLTSGLHSNGFINCRPMLARPNLTRIFAMQMIRLIGQEPQHHSIDWVVGPGNSATTLAYEIGRQMMVKAAFTEKDENNKPTKWGFSIPEGATVLLINELMTTGSGSSLQCKHGVMKYNPKPVNFLPFALLLVKRSKDETLADGTLVRPVFSFDINNWTPGECPYCQAGGEAIKPKVTPENWAKLTGQAA